MESDESDFDFGPENHKHPKAWHFNASLPGPTRYPLAFSAAKAI